LDKEKAILRFWKTNVSITEDGGWGEIRTHGTRERTPVFKTGALNRSATHPHGELFLPNLQ